MPIVPVFLDEVLRVFGLPAHPLVVHAVVVLVPLAAVSFAATGWNEAWRRAYYLPITLLALGGAVSALLATETGDSLEEAVKDAGRRVGDHPEQGDTAMILAIVFGICCVVALIVHSWGPSLRARFRIDTRLPVSDDFLVYLAVLPVAVIVVISVVIAGHSGAKLAWDTIR